MTEIMPFPENNILFYWAAPQARFFSAQPGKLQFSDVLRAEGLPPWTAPEGALQRVFRTISRSGSFRMCRMLRFCYGCLLFADFMLE